jgi:hypothetical protein
MNIIEAYIKKNNQLIILISGIDGSNKKKLAKNIEEDFKLKLLNLNDFINENFNEVIKLPNNETIIDWNSENIINWNKFNNAINENKNIGIIAYGFVFPSDKIKSNIDFHFHIKSSKKNIYDSIQNKIKKNNDNAFKSLLNEENIKYVINKIIYSRYLKNLNDNYLIKIDKFIHLNDKTNDEIYNDAFDYLIIEIEKNIYKK